MPISRVFLSCVGVISYGPKTAVQISDKQAFVSEELYGFAVLCDLSKWLLT